MVDGLFLPVKLCSDYARRESGLLILMLTIACKFIMISNKEKHVDEVTAFLYLLMLTWTMWRRF